MDAYCKCSKCGKDVKVDNSMVLTSNPPKYKYECKNCGNVDYIDCAATYNTLGSSRTFNISNSNNSGDSLNYYLNTSRQDCTSCIHSEVCKYREEFMKKLSSIDTSSDSFIRVRCECIHYKQNHPMYRDITWLNGAGTLQQVPEYTNTDCTNCDFMKKLLTDGSYVGDSPCEWCSKNPYKLTCTTGTAVNTTSQKRTIINEVLDTCCTMEEKKDV